MCCNCREDIILCSCYHAEEFATTQSQQCLSYSSKHVLLFLPSKISAQVKEGGDISSWFDPGQTTFWPTRGRHTLLPRWSAAGPCLLEEPGRYAL